MIGAVKPRPGSVNSGTAAGASTITGAFNSPTLQDSYVLFAVGGTSSAARTVTTPPTGLAQLYAVTNTNGASVGSGYVFGGIVAAGAAVPSLVLSSTLANAEWCLAEYQCVDVDNPIDGTPAIVNWVTATGAQTGAAGAITAALPSELAIGILFGRGSPTGIAGASGTPTTDHAPAGTQCAAALFEGAPAPGSVTPSASWTANSLGSSSLGMGGILLRPQTPRGWGITG